jgi:NAD(P)-dependent dehydrogenase (short-subunit alcohol dehydrogenase family)
MSSSSSNILDSFSLSGKTALITGGAGLYGRQIVEAIAGAGAKTFIASRNVQSLEEIAVEHRKSGRDVRALPLDQGDETSCLALRDAIREDSGEIDILINNAVARPVKDGYFCPAEDLAESMRINATGLILVTRIIGEILRDGGSILNIGSIFGLIGMEPANYRGTDMLSWSPDYFFHKGGMVNLTRFQASYYGQRGIRVNAIHPGGLGSMGHPGQFIKNYSERTCLGRMADDTDLMGIVVFLASDASKYITGTNIPVDGGYTAK